MEITKLGSQPSVKGPEDWFTGSVRINYLFQPNGHRRAGAAEVSFEPGARTAWHTHPLGQTLIVLSGIGLAQREGGAIEEIRPGDHSLDRSWGKTLAWSISNNRNDPYRHARGTERKSCGLDGESK